MEIMNWTKANQFFGYHIFQDSCVFNNIEQRSFSTHTKHFYMAGSFKNRPRLLKTNGLLLRSGLMN